MAALSRKNGGPSKILLHVPGVKLLSLRAPSYDRFARNMFESKF